MAIQAPDNQGIKRERAMIVPPPGELLTTPATLEQLKVPDEVLLRPENVAPFLASQAVRYNEVVNRPEIKSLEADIPEYLHDERSVSPTALLSLEEQSAVQSWVGERLGNEGEGLLKAQSADLDQLLNDTDQFIDAAVKSGQLKDAVPNSGGDVLEMMLLDKYQETEEEKKKFRETLAAAAKSGPESVLLALSYRQSQRSSMMMGKALESYKFHVDTLDKIRAAFDLKNSKGEITMSDMAKFNADIAGAQASVSQIFFAVQSAVQKNERVLSESSSIARQVHQSEERIIQNFKVT